MVGGTLSWAGDVRINIYEIRLIKIFFMRASKILSTTEAETPTGLAKQFYCKSVAVIELSC